MRLVFLNLSQNKFKVILTSVGIIVGSATIMMVIAIGTGGKMEVAEQFKNLNAGAIDISYESNATEFQGNSGSGNGGSGRPPMGMSGSGNRNGGSMPGPMMGGPGEMPEFDRSDSDRMNQEKIVLGTEDVEDIEVFVPGIADTTISYTTTSTIEGGELDTSASYTVAGVKDNYMDISNMEMLIGDFMTEENDESKDKICILGYSSAKEIFST